MTLSPHTIAPARGARTAKFRVGRGEGSGSGKTAGRGTKGQRSRSGGRNKLKMKGLKQMLLAFPKLRGFRSRYAKAQTIRLDELAKVFESGAVISMKELKAKHLIATTAGTAKVVGSGSIEKKFTLSGITASSSAAKAIEAAGGSIAKPAVAKPAVKR